MKVKNSYSKGKVSVIIPLYNAEKCLDKCLETMINQTYKDLEIIICDDCSKDNSYKKAKEWEKKDNRIKVYKNKENKKAGYTRNECIKKATGEYVFVQDADDYSDLTLIEKEVKILNKEKNISYVSAGLKRFNENGIWGEEIRKIEYPKNENFLLMLPYIHAGTLFRHDVLDKVNGYRVAKDTARTEDFDLFLRLHINKFYGKNILEALYYYNEDINAYKRRKYRYRIDEFKMKINAFKKLGLMPKGYIYACKPLIVGLVPRSIQYKLKQKYSDQEKRKIKVLEVVSNPNRGGVETMLMNIDRNIDHNKFQLDFTSFVKEESDYDKEINELGGQVVHLKPIREIGALKYTIQMKNMIKERKYDIVHSHISINNSLVLLAAKLAGVKIRISHAHTTSSEKPNTLKFNIAVSLMKKLNKMCANVYCACGEKAGEFLYGKKALEKGKVIVINNAIELDKFAEYFGKKEEVREKNKFNKKDLLIGHIGRFDGEVKNHKFIIEMAEKMKKDGQENFKFVLVGKGSREEEFKKLVKEKGLNDNVIFYGLSENIPELLQAFDVMILPSLYEGLPVVLVEAQAAGIKVLASENITKEVDLGLGLVKFLAIDKGPDVFVKEINKTNKKEISWKKIYDKLTEKGFNIKVNVKQIEELYEKGRKK